MVAVKLSQVEHFNQQNYKSTSQKIGSGEYARQWQTL